MGPDGQPLPFRSDEEVLEFLRSAKPGKAKETKKGITRPRKVVLEKNGIRAHAIFHTIDESKPVVTLKSGERIMNFRDSYIFQPAAYELARMLGLDNVPPSVRRRVFGESGSMTLWLENMRSEEDRRKAQSEPPDHLRWSRQMAIMHVWDNLIFNFDRNQGNILIDGDWNIWLIDHTRTFRRGDETPTLHKVRSCDRRLLERLRSLTEQEVKQRLNPYLSPPEIDFLMKRRDKVVAHIDRMIAERGEDQVLFNYL